MSGSRQETNVEASAFQTRNRKRKRQKRGCRSLADSKKLIMGEEWTRTVHSVGGSPETQRFNRSTVADRFRRDSTCQATNGESFNSYSLSEKTGNHLASTQKWRELLFNNEAHGAPIVISEEIFKENVNVLLSGIDACALSPSKWSREDTNVYFNKIVSFVDSWKRQLVKEREKIDEEVCLLKRKLDNKRDLVTNRLSVLTGVFDESLAFIEFSRFQKQAIESKVRELNDVGGGFKEIKQIKIIKKEPINLGSSEFSLATKLESKEKELIEARNEHHKELIEVRKQADESRKELIIARKDIDWYREELKRTQASLRGSRKQTEEHLQELKETENKLKETQEELKNFVVKGIEMTQSKQKEMKEKLSEIRSMLVMEKPSYLPSRQIEIENLSQNDTEIFKDIKALIQYEIPLDKCNNCKVNTKESSLETDGGSSSLRVSEYEMHLVTLIASFLKISPFPLSAGYIYSYVANIDYTVDLQFVENLLKRFPSFFKQVAVAPGSMEKNWSYLDLKPVITI